VSERLAVPAMITTHGRLDQAGAVAVAAGKEREAFVTGVASLGRRLSGRHDGLGLQMPGDRVAHQVAKFGVIHTTSTESTMPMTAVSTGTAFLFSTSPAARPSSTMSTFS